MVDLPKIVPPIWYGEMNRPRARYRRMRFCVLRKPPTRTMISQSKDVPYTLRGSFIGILRSAFGFVFADRPGHRGGFTFQPAVDLRTSISPRLRCTLASLDILQSRLGVLHEEGSRQFDQVFGQAFPFLLGDHGRVVSR